MRCVLRNWRAVSVSTAALILVSCASRKHDWVELKPDAAGPGPSMQITGTVHHLDLEGGLYVIRGTEGTNYHPTNLPEAFRVAGMAVQADARRRDDLASIGMVGPIVDLVRIRVRSDDIATVSGTVTHRERLALPPDAVVEVQLADVSRQDVAATIVAETSVPTHGRQVPIPFDLAYDPAKVVENHTYAVRAVIRSEGELLFTTSSHYPAITRGNPSVVDLVLVRADEPTDPMESLRGTSWVLADLAGAGVMDSVRATLVFSEDGAVSGSASCNQFRGTVTSTSASIAFSPLATTRMSCAEAVMDQEARYLAALQEAERFEIQEAFLYIHAAGRPRPLRFIRADESKRDR